MNYSSTIKDMEKNYDEKVVVKLKDIEKRLISLLIDYELEKMTRGENENLFFKRVLNPNSK